MASCTVMAQESLTRAVSSQSVMNYQGIFDGFMAMGIPESEIKPRENVFTFWAWKALGRRVKKGEHGVKACTFVPVGGKEMRDDQTGEVKKTAGFRMARTTTVFHISQTEPEDSVAAFANSLTSEQAIHLLDIADPLTEAEKSVTVEQLAKELEISPLISRFRKWADAMQSKIDHAGRPMTQNPTPKRNREYQSRMHDCRNMERTQKALRVLADAHEAGTISDALANLKTRDEVSGLVRKAVSGNGGYYSVIECSDYAVTSPVARELQGMIDGNSAQRVERDRLHVIETLKAEIALSTIPGYFPTQAPVVAHMLKRARIAPGMTFLEPQAGSGHIADAIRAEIPAAKIDTCEVNPKLRQLLTLKGYAPVADDFIEWSTANLYDRIIMNPPFEKQADIEHVRKAYGLLSDYGVLVSVMAPGFEFRQDRKSAEFRQWLEDVNAAVEDLPDGSFKASGTAIRAKLVIIEMQ